MRMACEMVDEKLINKDEALRRVEPEALNQLLRPVFAWNHGKVMGWGEADLRRHLRQASR